MRIYPSPRSPVQHIDKKHTPLLPRRRDVSLRTNHTNTTERERERATLTKKDDMYASLIKPFCYSLPLFPSAIVGVIDDNLASTFEEFPNELFATLRDFLTEFNCFGGFLAFFLKFEEKPIACACVVCLF